MADRSMESRNQPSDVGTDKAASEMTAKPPGMRFGPGLLVTAAFIGPGTVISASKAGAQFGCELLWTIVFASLGAIVLQLFAARLGILTKRGLGESIRLAFARSIWLKPIVALVIAAIGIGNAAYQTGNLSGAATGLSSLLGGTHEIWIVAIAVSTLGILSIGRFQTLQRTLVALVIVLSLSFIAAAAVSLPSWTRLVQGALVPTISPQNLTLVLALIGTKIVPYNLFLHSSSAAENWASTRTPVALRQATLDTVLSIALGGLVTAGILITANSAFFDSGVELGEAAQIAQQLQPTLGWFSQIAFALGMFSAGLTSSITAPLATAFALCGVLGWECQVKSWRFRIITLSVVNLGAFFAIWMGGSPAQTILFAQVANSLLLPVIAVLLLGSAWQQREPATPLPLLIAGGCICLGITALAGWKLLQTLLLT